MYRGIRLASIAGVEVRADWSLMIIFLLITLNLAMGLFPAWHPEWSPGLAWLTALGAAGLFFGSVLAHELSHALVGRMGGVSVRRITLFVFGGMAHMENEPPSWRVELRMAIAGPIVSIVIGFGALALVSSSLGALDLGDESQALKVIATLSPGATILLWLGWVNLILGLFNLVPGFPLDGGRVLRSVIWAVTGDHRRSTHIASLLGQMVAWLLIALGLAMLFGATVPLFGRGFVGGMWLILIGWFLNNAAIASYRSLLVLDALRNVTVGRLMQEVATRVDPDITVAQLVDHYLMASGQQVFPVERDKRFIGWVTLQNLRQSDRSAWSSLRAGDIMTAAAELPSLHPRQEANEAVPLMNQSDTDPLPVLEGERLVGVLSKADLAKWLSLHMDLKGDDSAVPLSSR